jgi:CRISPR associated protein Cas1
MPGNADVATPRARLNRQSPIGNQQSPTLPPPKPVSREIRQLVTPRDDLRPLYLNAQGVRVGKSGEVLQVREKDALKQEVRIGEICQVNLMGNVQFPPRPSRRCARRRNRSAISPKVDGFMASPPG